jgi:glycine hydroxymethyltransferase
VTTRGFAAPEVEQLANLIADVLDAPADDKVVARAAADVTALCRRFPVYAGELAGA